ncbi:MAG: YwiC-like family protein [Deltaproteobacteria bacterium]|nr:YwiC-like family protein [Deltaproteobacteria bacterium]
MGFFPRDILLPNEHGAWGMLVTAFLLGWLGAPELSRDPLLLLPAALGGFLTRYPVGIYFKKRRVTRQLGIPLKREKKWFLIYSIFTLLVGLPLLHPLGWWWLLPFTFLATLALALHLTAIIQRKERTLFVEITAMLGISLLAPAAAYAASKQFDWKIFILWILFVLFYTQRIIAIKEKVARRKETGLDIRKVGKRELIYSSLFFLAVILWMRISG